MRFVSDEQRRAVMAQMRGIRRVSSRSIKHAEKKTWGRLSGVQKAAVAGTVAAGGIALGMRPVVSHGAIRELPRLWGAHVAAYTGAPIAGAVYQIQKDKERREVLPALRSKKAVIAGAGAVGLASFLGERGLLHSLPDFVPKRAWSIDVMKMHTRRGAFVLQHGLPLVTASIGLGYLGRRLLGRSKQRRETAKKYQLGVSAVGAHGRIHGIIALPAQAAAILPARAVKPALFAYEALYPAVVAGPVFGSRLVSRAPKKPPIRQRLRKFTSKVRD